jgi:hypothetical protein
LELADVVVAFEDLSADLAPAGAVALGAGAAALIALAFGDSAAFAWTVHALAYVAGAWQAHSS